MLLIHLLLHVLASLFVFALSKLTDLYANIGFCESYKVLSGKPGIKHGKGKLSAIITKYRRVVATPAIVLNKDTGHVECTYCKFNCTWIKDGKVAGTKQLGVIDKHLASPSHKQKYNEEADRKTSEQYLRQALIRSFQMEELSLGITISVEDHLFNCRVLLALLTNGIQLTSLNSDLGTLLERGGSKLRHCTDIGYH